MAFLRQLGRGNRSNEASAAKATARRAQTLAFPSLASRSAASAIANSFSICSNLTPCIMDNLRYQVADKMGQALFQRSQCPFWSGRTVSNDAKMPDVLHQCRRA